VEGRRRVRMYACHGSLARALIMAQACESCARWFKQGAVPARPTAAACPYARTVRAAVPSRTRIGSSAQAVAHLASTCIERLIRRASSRMTYSRVPKRTPHAWRNRG
jgi:hypothetical protein